MQTLSGLVGTRCTAGHGQKDRNHRRFPAGRQARQGRRLTNPRCVRATHGWRRALQIRARKPRRCTQGVRQISGSPNRSGHRQDHSRTSLPKGAHQQIGAHHQRNTRKEESAPGCGHETVQSKRTSSSARAADPALARATFVADWMELFLEAVSLGFTSKTGHDVSYGVWFKRRPAHLVQIRRCSWKGVRRQCWEALGGLDTQQAESTRISSSIFLAHKNNETNSSKPYCSSGPPQDSKSLGPKGQDPKWPSGSGWSSHQIFRVRR